MMRAQGAVRIYAKVLSPNDNSKNQVYLGGGFSALNVIPHGDIYTDEEDKGGSVRERAKARVTFYWIDEDGRHRAPDVNLILYPKYPEIRISGFLRGCDAAPTEIMTVRDPGRTLFFGVTMSGDVLGYAAAEGDPISEQLLAGQWNTLGVFLELPLDLEAPTDTKSVLIGELRRVYNLGWVSSQKLARDGRKQPYAARNGGGYTLEAELGISPNGYSEPDFMGWEVKQYGVSDFTRLVPKNPVTLMTPEPTGGVYRDEGVPAFLRAFGYPDQSGRGDRINFGGAYACGGVLHHLTGLRMVIDGYDGETGLITDMDGSFRLVDVTGTVAASWNFKAMMSHWNRKHAQAAYVPSIFRTPPPKYAYGGEVLLCEQTDFMLFIRAFAAGAVYYDPGIKMENASAAKPALKCRSQFRIRHAHLASMYHHSETVALNAGAPIL
jgi:hypothetical protein